MRLPLPALIVACAGTVALAQGTVTPFADFEHDSTQPVEITSDALEVDQAAGKAVFTGSVKVAQGMLRMASDRLEVFYVQAPARPEGEKPAKAERPKAAEEPKDAGAKAAEGPKDARPAAGSDGSGGSGGSGGSEGSGGSGGGIDHMIATGNVTLATGAEAAEAERASYVVAAGIVEMAGDVLLTQGPNALSGEKLFIDLNAGTGRMEGRVKTIFTPQSAPQSASRPAGTRP